MAMPLKNNAVYSIKLPRTLLNAAREKAVREGVELALYVRSCLELYAMDRDTIEAQIVAKALSKLAQPRRIINIVEGSNNLYPAPVKRGRGRPKGSRNKPKPEGEGVMPMS